MVTAMVMVMVMDGDEITECNNLQMVVEILDHEVLQDLQDLPDHRDILEQEASLVRVVKRDRLVFVVHQDQLEFQEKKEMMDATVKLGLLDRPVLPVRPDLLECQDCPA